VACSPTKKGCNNSAMRAVSMDRRIVEGEPCICETALRVTPRGRIL
jgi:hypothetical protein